MFDGRAMLGQRLITFRCQSGHTSSILENPKEAKKLGVGTLACISWNMLREESIKRKFAMF